MIAFLGTIANCLVKLLRPQSKENKRGVPGLESWYLILSLTLLGAWQLLSFPHQLNEMNYMLITWENLLNIQILGPCSALLDQKRWEVGLGNL